MGHAAMHEFVMWLKLPSPNMKMMTYIINKYNANINLDKFIWRFLNLNVLFANIENKRSRNKKYVAILDVIYNNNDIIITHLHENGNKFHTSRHTYVIRMNNIRMVNNDKIWILVGFVFGFLLLQHWSVK